MNTQDELARTAERLSDALTAAADVMAMPDQATTFAVVPRHPGRLGRTRPWLVPLAAAACVIAVIVGSVVLAANLVRKPTPVSQPMFPTATACEPLPAAGPGPRVPEFYVTADVTPHDILLQVRHTSGCAVTAVVPLPAGWLLTGGIAAASGGHTFYIAAFTGKGCPIQQRPGGAPSPARGTRFFRFTVDGDGRAGRLTAIGPVITGLIGPIAVSPDGTRIAFNAASGNFVGSRNGCGAMGLGEGGAISVLDLATGKILTWQTDLLPAGPTGPTVTPHEVSWLADGRTLAISYVWPTSSSGPQLSMAVAELDTTSADGSLLAHGHVVWSDRRNCALCVQEALISPDGKSLTAAAVQQTAHGVRHALLRIALPSGHVRVLYESPVEPDSAFAFSQDGSGQHFIWVSGSKVGWVTAGRLVLLEVPGTALETYYAVTTIAW